MKRLFFLLIVAVASVLPQSVWASSYTTNDGTLTVNSDAAGYLAGLTKTAEMKACTKIVLIGKFNASDLESIQAANSTDFQATEVDMADAQFVLADNEVPEQAFYYLYPTGTQLGTTGTTGDRAIVGGTLYKSAQNLLWNDMGYAPSEGSTVHVRSNNNPNDAEGQLLYTYGKIQNGHKYLQMHVIGAEMVGPISNNGVINPNEVLSNPETEYVLNSILNDPGQPYGKNFAFWRYYKCVNNGSGLVWQATTKEEYDAAAESSNQIYNEQNVNLVALDAGTDNTNTWGNEGKVMSTIVYYTKYAQSREWQTGSPTSEQMDAATIASFDYAYRENHKDYSDGTWVKMTDYTYYQLLATGAWHWEQVDYENGEGHYINKKYESSTNMSSTSDGLPNADNQYAVKMGSNSGDGEYYRNGSSWKDPQNATNTPHYVDMKFSYWSSTLQKATTSKYADEDINPDIFQNCNALTDVNFKAGVVKGFGDHTTPVNSLTVNIGQNVTAIASNAFIRCTALKKVTFDAGNGSETISGKTYPLALEISNGAFEACSNLAAIEIPNRVTVIGNDAFKNAGNNITSEKGFEVSFQRRYVSDLNSDPIDGWRNDMNLTIGTDAFAYCTKLKTISLPIRMTSMGNGIFQNSGLEHFVIREDIENSLLKTIPENAFLACQLKDINIPRSVTLIKAGAFSNTPTIETIRFQKQNGTTQEPLTIMAGAFSGGSETNQALKDVYVDFSHTERLVICEYNAFNFTSMVGQTNTENRQFAKLHFPKGDWDYYQGNWKRGLAFRQDNLNAFKDGYHGKWGGISTENDCAGFGTEPIDPATGKYTKDGYTGVNAKYIAPANGWQQFAYSDTDIDILIPWGSYMRTFSTNTPYVIPTYATTETTNGITVQAGAPMFKIYRITAFSDGWASGQNKTSAELAQASTRVAKALEVNDTDRPGRKYIPSETGLMMVGLINADYIVYFADADFTSGGSEKTEKKYPYNISGYTDASPSNMNVNDGTDINLLYPACIDNQRMDGLGGTSEAMTGEPTIGTYDGVSKILLRSSIPCPYHSYDSDLKFRLFCYYSTPNQFKRVNNGKVTRDKAYLKLPKELFHWSNEYTSGEAGGSTSGVTDPTAAAAAREISLNFFDDDEESETTGIKQVDTTAQRTDSNVFYTLEGVKLNNRPTQRGIYIHNGRKVVIK